MSELRYCGRIGAVSSQTAYCADGTLIKFEVAVGVPVLDAGEVLTRVWDNDDDAIFDIWEASK